MLILKLIIIAKMDKELEMKMGLYNKRYNKNYKGHYIFLHDTFQNLKCSR